MQQREARRDPGATTYSKSAVGLCTKYIGFANSGRVRLKFGHTKLGREIKTGKLMFSRGNNPLHTHMAATCSIAAALQTSNVCEIMDGVLGGSPRRCLNP